MHLNASKQCILFEEVQLNKLFLFQTFDIILVPYVLESGQEKN